MITWVRFNHPVIFKSNLSEIETLGKTAQHIPRSLSDSRARMLAAGPRRAARLRGRLGV